MEKMVKRTRSNGQRAPSCLAWCPTRMYTLVNPKKRRWHSFFTKKWMKSGWHLFNGFPMKFTISQASPWAQGTSIKHCYWSFVQLLRIQKNQVATLGVSIMHNTSNVHSKRLLFLSGEQNICPCPRNSTFEQDRNCSWDRFWTSWRRFSLRQQGCKNTSTKRLTSQPSSSCSSPSHFVPPRPFGRKRGSDTIHLRKLYNFQETPSIAMSSIQLPTNSIAAWLTWLIRC